MADEAMDCSIVECKEKAEYLMLFSLTPSRVGAVKDAHLLLPSGYRCCQTHLPKGDFWSYVKEPDWEELCQALEEKGIPRPIREMAELTFLRLP